MNDNNSNNNGNGGRTPNRNHSSILIFLVVTLVRLVLMSFFKPNLSKFWAKNFVKLDHSGSSQGSKIVLSLNVSGLYSR